MCLRCISHYSGTVAHGVTRSVFGGYLFHSHAQTTALISSTLIFQSLRGNFKTPQKFLKIIAAILTRSVVGGYLFNSHAQTTALISSTLIFQSLFESVLKLPHKIYLINNIACGTDFFKLKNISEHLSYSKEKYPFYNKETRRGKIR